MVVSASEASTWGIKAGFGAQDQPVPEKTVQNNRKVSLSQHCIHLIMAMTSVLATAMTSAITVHILSEDPTQ